ncbi:amino acid carrier family protein [[Clostridium] sordellii ATCC 9714]|nr:amino acid carrier family protein [[Clostridium] sordellii ATCC 9714] [Paeniclostridium sordellii ATCC 9714]
MEVLTKVVDSVNSILWDKNILLVLLVGTGVWYTFQLKFVQIRGFGEGFRRTFGGLFKKGENADKEGMSQFQSLATAIAAQVGTGNLAGAATAIAVGGPGAIFWMWVSAFFGMATIYAEATMAQKYKKIGDDKSVTGGPVYYIEAAFKGKFGKFLAGSFAVFIILALGFMGNAVQSNSIAAAFDTAFGISPLLIGIILAVLSFAVFSGGISRIAKVTETIVPIMALFYIIGSLIVILFNFRNIPLAFQEIFVGAFAPQSIAGGVIGATIQKAMSKGVARGLFLMKLVWDLLLMPML